MSDSSTVKFRIGIIGGGIGGLALAALLLTDRLLAQHISIQLFERDPSVESRAQGYALTIQWNGMSVLREIDLQDSLHSLECRCERNYSFRADGSVLAAFDPKYGTKNSKKNNIPIPRQQLRKLLIEKIEKHDKSVLHWGMSMTDFEETRQGVKTRFVSEEDSFVSTMDFDLLVGCDGIRSTVREKLVPNAKINNLGYWMVNGIVGWGTLPEASEQQQGMLKNTVFQVVDGTSRFFVKPFLPGKSMWQLTFPVTNADASICSSLSEDLILDKVKSLTKYWTHDLVKLLLDNTLSDTIRSAPLCDLDPLKPWKTCRITMIGDAVHPMTPFRGMGANNALVDALSLRRVIAAHILEGRSLMQRLQHHESKMLERTNRIVLSSRNSTTFLHKQESLDLASFFRYWGLAEAKAEEMTKIVANIEAMRNMHSAQV